jgi:hypothetical protein
LGAKVPALFIAGAFLARLISLVEMGVNDASEELECEVEWIVRLVLLESGEGPSAPRGNAWTFG